MTERSATPPSGSDRGALVEIDITVPHTARVYDYLAGGMDNFEVDRKAAERASEAYGGLEIARAGVRGNRAFLGRAVRYLVSEVGIRQFLDLGTGIPNADNVHGVAQRTAPDCRIVYVDNDPVVLAHSHQLLDSTTAGATAYLNADIRDPETILRQAASTLDFTRPIGLMMVAILHELYDEDDPHGIVTRLLDAVPSGSYLVLSHLSHEIMPEATARFAEQIDERTAEPLRPRSRDDVVRFFTRLDLVEPGVIDVDNWRPDDQMPEKPFEGWMSPVYCGVGRKP